MSTALATALDPQDATESAGARHAALLLHGMAPVDRAWVLDAMPADQRASLRSLLEELEALGIASDPDLIGDATSPMGPQNDPALQDAPLSDEERLFALQGERLAGAIEALRREPAGLLAHWLRVADWPWQEDLLRALEPAHRRRVESALAIPASVPPAMRAELIAAVAATLRRPLPSDPSLGRWHAIGRTLRGAWPLNRNRRRASR